ncbi:MAG: hypothetical protein U0W24_17870 [Bacteroidales bacterium]
MKKRIIVIILVSGIFLNLACIKEKFDQDLLSRDFFDSTTVAVPVGYDSTTLLQILQPQIDSGFLIVENDGLLRFRFNSGSLTVTDSDLIQYPVFDTVWSVYNTTGLPIDLNPAGTQVQINQTFYLDFGFSQRQRGEITDSLLLNNMEMNLDVQAAGTLNASLNAAFPGIRYNNLVYDKNLVVSSSNHFSDLMAFTVYPDNSQNPKNLVEVNFTLTLHQTARIIAPGEKIVDLTLRFLNIDYNTFYGYIGQVSLSPPSIGPGRIELLNNNLSGYFNFVNGYFDLLYQNQLGVPFSFNLSNFSYATYYTPDNSLVYQNNSVPTGNTDILYPSISQEGQTINGEGLILTGPVQMAFNDYYSLLNASLTGQANPQGNAGTNFVKKGTELNIVTGYTLPFEGNTDNLMLTDTVNFPLSAFFSSTLGNMQRLLFVMNFTNAVPMDAQTQVYFCDLAGNHLDSMFQIPVLVPGSSNADGEGKIAPQPAPPVKAEILASRIPGIMQTDYLLVVSKLKTIEYSNNPPRPWKFFRDYFFYVNIGVAATLKQ